jgi:signal transduction histidine kinase
VITLSNEGQVEIYNAASLNLLNTNVGFQKQSIDDVIKVHDQSGEPVKLFEVAKKAKGVKIRDDLLLVNDDETIRLEVTSSPVRSSYSRSKGNSSADGYILILRDITKSKSLEEERDEFISVVSHELRTPITVVEGTLSNVQLMVKKGKTPPGTLERSLADAHDQIMFLSRMVNDLSTLSRAERGVADTAEPIDVRSMIDSLYKEYSPQADKKNLHFNIDTSGRLGTVTASHLYLRELLQNMITNAIKYTKEGSVTLSAARSGDHIAFTVKDTGIGISKSDQTKIFNKFYRSEDYRTRETGGTGLGLYVAAKLAKKLGTSIEVKSRLNHGSSFSFTMPVDSKTKS